MIESIEGKRGMPRLRPPYVAQVGLFGRPTLEHNMETLLLGARHRREGRRVVRRRTAATAARACARSRCRAASTKPGVHLAPAGITVQELIDEYCGGMLPGHEFYAYLPGGASGGILPASLGDIPLDFDTLQPHGCFIGSAAVIILSDKDTATHRRAQRDEVLRGRIVRPVHAVPRRHREGGRPDGAAEVGPARCSKSFRWRWPTPRSAASARPRRIRSAA